MNDSSKYQKLVTRAQKGDLQAKRDLYMSTVHSVYLSCLRLMNCEAAAKDITQEAYMQAFDKLDSIKDAHRFAGWLKRIATNLCLQKKRKEIHFEPVEQLELIDNTEDYQEIEWSTIKEVISSLPTSCQTIFNLYVLDEYKHHEIADMLSISVGTSKSQLNYAKKLLREKLQVLIER